jgi:hypothetical protein
MLPTYILESKTELQKEFDQCFQLMNSGLYLSSQHSSQEQSRGRQQINEARKKMEEIANKSIRKRTVIHAKVKPIITECDNLKDKVHFLKKKIESLQQLNDSIFSDFDVSFDDKQANKNDVSPGDQCKIAATQDAPVDSPSTSAEKDAPPMHHSKTSADQCKIGDTQDAPVDSPSTSADDRDALPMHHSKTSAADTPVGSPFDNVSTLSTSTPKKPKLAH